MSTPHIEHFVDERGNFIYRAEFEGSFLSKDEAKELGKRVSGILDENAKLREELAKARDPQRIGGQADPSSFVYAIEQLREFRWQHATNDEDAIPYINNVAAAHERENAKLREQLERVQPTDCEGNALDIADTVHMLRSEYDGDHEWEDVVTELVLTKWGGDRWIVRGSKGEAWACDCTKTGYDEDAYEASDDVEPFDESTLLEVENAKLRALVRDMWSAYHDGATNKEFRALPDRMRELGVEL